MKFDRKALLLYAVTDTAWLGGKALSTQVEMALEGGVTFLQYRDKSLGDPAFLEEAAKLRALCRRYKVPFVVNDRVALAIEAGADGVHVGQEDMEAGAVRERIGPGMILGVSVQTVEEAQKAQTAGADYLGVGAVFPTETKKDAAEVPLETLKAICKAVSIPVVAIGGITAENLHALRESGIAGVALVSAIFAQEHILEATERLKASCEEGFSRDKRGNL